MPVRSGSAGGGGGLGPWSSVLYVDNVRGNDATAVRGDDNHPYQTIQAALNAMQTDDLVLLAPQTFTITAALTIPATVLRGAMAGMSGQVGGDLATQNNNLGVSKITSTSAIAALISFGANLGMTAFSLANMQMLASGGVNTAILADGTAYAQNAFFAGSGGLVLDHLHITATNALVAKYVVRTQLDACQISGDLSWTSCGTHTLVDVDQSSGAVLEDYDATDVKATTAQSLLNSSQGSQLGVVTIARQGRLISDALSRVLGVVGSNLAVAAGKAPSCTVSGVLGTSGADFASAGAELPDTATALTWTFQGAELRGSSFQFKVAGAAANAQTVNMDATNAPSGATFVAGQGITLTGKGASWPYATLSTPAASGDIWPPQFATGPTILTSTLQAIAMPCRLTSPNYEVDIDLDTLADAPAIATSRARGQFQLQSTGATGSARTLITILAGPTLAPPAAATLSLQNTSWLNSPIDTATNLGTAAGTFTAAGAARPTSVLFDGLKGAGGDGAGVYMSAGPTTGAIISLAQFTFGLVFRANVLAGAPGAAGYDQRALLGDGNGAAGGNFYPFILNTSGLSGGFFSAADHIVAPIGITAGVVYVALCWFDGTTFFMRCNGVTSSVATLGNVGSGVVPLQLFTNYLRAVYANADIAAIQGYNTALSLSDRNQLAAYLYSRYPSAV